MIALLRFVAEKSSSAKHMLVYGNPNFLTTDLPKTTDSSVLFYVNKGGSYQAVTQGQVQEKGEEFRKQNSIKKDDTLLVIGNGTSPSVFAYGIMTLTSTRY